MQKLNEEHLFDWHIQKHKAMQVKMRFGNTLDDGRTIGYKSISAIAPAEHY